MATLALILYALFVALVVGLRMLIQLRRTGSTGFHGIDGQAGPAEWAAAICFVLAVVLGVAAPILALLDAIEPISALDVTAVHAVGVALYVLGIAAIVHAQMAMGASWRIGVDPACSSRA